MVSTEEDSARGGPSAEQWRRRDTRVSTSRALSSTTRAGIFEHLRDGEEAHTVRDVADTFDLHPNVARTHLELLADAGLLIVGRRKHPGGGRPAKVYRAADGVETDDVPPAVGDQVAARLQVRLLTDLLPTDREVEHRAFEAGVAEGRRLVEPLVDRTLDALADATETVVRALRPHVGNLRVVKQEADRVDLTGLTATFELLTTFRPLVAEAFQRGVVEGAFAVAGQRVAVSPAGTLPDGERVWSVASAGPGSNRVGPLPVRRVDARSMPREQGVVRAMREITPLRHGQVLEVLAEGPGSPAAFARWVDRAGHELLGVERAANEGGRPAIRLLIRKGRS
jgi:TusA-related sulfurtransferase/DNA-binding transcriptional ArsR family regulator